MRESVAAWLAGFDTGYARSISYGARWHSFT
jgi:hypothetical protein